MVTGGDVIGWRGRATYSQESQRHGADKLEGRDTSLSHFCGRSRAVPRVVWLGVERRCGVEGGKNRVGVGQLETGGSGGGGLLDGVREGLAWQTLAPEGLAWRKLEVGMGSKRPELPLAS